jgi:hypothetical protein
MVYVSGILFPLLAAAVAIFVVVVFATIVRPTLRHNKR